MRRFTTFFLLGLALCWLALVSGGCSSTPGGIPSHRPGDFRLGVVVMSGNQAGSANQDSDLAGGDGRYIVDSSSVLRASFGSGSTLDTFPGFTRRLTHDQMDAIWLMAKDMLEHNEHHTKLNAGQPQSMIGEQAGTIIEIHLNAHDEVFMFDQDDQQAAAIVDALAALAWVDTTPNKLP